MNPEFRRLLIVEFQGHRLIAMPAVLVAVFGTAYFLNNFRWDVSTSFISTLGYFALVFVWGTRQAADSVIQEINAKTWSPQRMSAMSAWSMTWAKLAGSTVFSWIGGVVCLAIYAASNREWWDTERLYVSVSMYLFAGVLAQTVCFLTSLAAIQRRREFGRVQVVAYQFLGLLFALPPLYIGLSVTGGAGLMDLIIWYDQYLTLPQFMLIFMGLFIGWGLIGAWALMRSELQQPLSPWLWLVFAIFVMVFFGGMRSVPITPNMPAAMLDFPSVPSVVFVCGLTMIYVMALIETKNRYRVRLWHLYVRNRAWRRLFDIAPRSLLTIPVVAVATVVAVVGFGDYDTAHGQKLHLLFTAALLFAIRDLIFIYWSCLGRTDGRGETMAAIILIMVYIVVPGTLSQAAAHVQPEIGYLIAFFAPAETLPGWWTILAPLAEICAMGYVLRRRWLQAVQRFDTDEAAGG